MDKCKFCGARERIRYASRKRVEIWYECGATESVGGKYEFSALCLRRQLAQSEARGRELWEALASLFETRWTDANWRDTQFLVDKHAEHFRKESEVTNGSM
jgi:hypothetical protein